MTFPTETARSSIGLIAGKGIYPRLLIEGARRAGVNEVVMAAFHGETSDEVREMANECLTVRVGQLSKMIKFFKKNEVTEVIMAGQITPKNLFEFRPDLRTMMMLGRLKERNADTIFGAIGDELAKEGIELISATTFMEDSLAKDGHLFGPKFDAEQMQDADYAMRIAKEVSRLDIGQSVVVRHGTVLAVEAFEGTNDCVRRGGAMGKGQALLAKVSKPAQDFRFDVPVIGPDTIRVAAEAGVKAVVLESGKTLVLDIEAVGAACGELGVGVMGVTPDEASSES